MKTVGVLGGMGPDATIHFMQRVVSLTRAGDDIEHIPMLIDNNTQVPSRIKALIEKTGEDPAPVISKMATSLVKTGAEFLVMPCNTAHNYAASVVSGGNVEFLNMVTLSCEKLRAQGFQKIGLLGSPALRLTGVYDRPMEVLGMGVVYLQNDTLLLDAIKLLKRDISDAEARRILREASAALHAQGADCLLIACSEFSAAPDTFSDAHLPVFDSIEILARETVIRAGATLSGSP